MARIKLRNQRLAARRRRAFTLVETMMAIAVSALVMGGVLYVQYVSTRTIKELYGPTRARSDRMHSLNFLRFTLANAKIGSCVVSESGHRIDFIDPTQGTTITAAFRFVPEDQTLYYDDNVNANPGFRTVAKGPIDIQFILGTTMLDAPNFVANKGADGIVTLFVRTASHLAYSNVDLRDGETVVHLRNP